MTALVTGAGRRIGAELALGLARQGHDVAVHYNASAEGAEAVAAQIRAMGQRAVTLQADLLDQRAARDLLPRAADAFGPVTVLVNNASIFEHDDITTATDLSWDRHLGSNLRAPFLLAQAMAAQGLTVGRGDRPMAEGLIVNMVDQRVKKPTPEFMTYSLAKAGLWWLTQTLAQALAPAIRVNAIGPGPTLRGVRQSADHFAAQVGGTILGRGAEPDDAVQALAYLLTAHSVTGQLLLVDSGQHLGWQTPDIIRAR